MHKQEEKIKGGNNTSREEQQDNQSETFQFEEVPSRMIMLDPSTQDGEINMIVYHAGKILYIN